MVHLTSEGSGAVLSSANATRLFQVSNGAELQLSNVHLRDGRALAADRIDQQDGGALTVATGSTVVLTHSTIANCSAYRGGGVHVDGGSSLVLRSSAILQCASLGTGGGIYATGGSAVYLSDGAVMQDCHSGTGAISRVIFGGGIYIAASTLSINASRISRSAASALACFLSRLLALALRQLLTDFPPSGALLTAADSEQHHMAAASGQTWPVPWCT
eukprot:5509228-Prymnesium_polylepis.1